AGGERATRAGAAGDLVLSARAWEQLAARSAEPIARGEAWLALADLATRLHDPARARAALARSLPDLPPSPLREAVLRRLAAAQAEAGESEAAARLLEALGGAAGGEDLVRLAEAYQRT